MEVGGLEPPKISPPDPKSGASTNSAIPPKTLLCYPATDSPTATMLRLRLSRLPNFQKDNNKLIPLCEKQNQPRTDIA
jgi:hypothetical protein